MSNESSSSLGHYLQMLDHEPLLTKKEEEELVKKVEELQDNILIECASYYFFKGELIDLLLSLKSSGDDIINISKSLDQDSKSEQKKTIRTALMSLLEHLAEPRSPEQTKEALKKVNLTGNVINSLVERIKKKHAKIKECDDDLSKLLKFFSAKDEDALVETINLLKNDDHLTKVSQDSMIPKVDIQSKVHIYEQYRGKLSSLLNSGLAMEDLPEIKKIYKEIEKQEFQMKHYKDILVQRNMRLVVSRAKKFVNKGLDFDDLIQEGNIGLIKAINKYDLSRGTKISTYATWWIDQTIRRAISNKSRTVRIPTHIEFLQSTLAGVISDLSYELGRAPKLEEIAERSGVDLEKLKGLQQRAMHQIGIEDDLGSGMRLIDILPADSSKDPFSTTSRKMMREKVRQILSTLNPRTEKIIRLRYGIGEPQEEMTLREIAEKVGLSRMGVSVIQNKTLKEIKGANKDLEEE